MTKEEFEKLSEELKMDICREIAYEYAIFVPKDEPRAISKFKSIVYRGDEKFLENEVLQKAEDRYIFPYDMIMGKIEKLVENYYREFRLGANVHNVLSDYGERGEKFKTYFEDCLKSSENTTKGAVKEELFRRLLSENDVKSAIKRVGDVVSRRTTFLEKLLESLAGQMEQFMVLCECQKEGFANYRIRTNGDNCKECTTLDGKIFPVSDAKLGENIPPFHPNCDCTIEVLNESGNPMFAIERKYTSEEECNDWLGYFNNPPVIYIDWNGLEEDHDKEVLSKEDYEQIQMLTAIFNYAKYVLKDDSIADEAYKKTMTIRRQDKYGGKRGYGPVHGTATSNELQFANLEGAVDNYDYSDSKANVKIQINKPLSALDAQYLTREWISAADESGAFGIIAEKAGYNADKWSLIGMIVAHLNEKLNPLFGKVCEGDNTVYVEKKGQYWGGKEYLFFFSEKDKKNFYYVKR